ncbi:hypothetical protein [Lachnospira eligens]|jgi:hypothetical protein|uniref:Uncharacterized protein n=1 Tax=Lachnospira eligens TaxID=39485 RepID=A0A415MEL4_9FIRM|nr:hypothetical protein [Lachnospira eligens]RHA50433.1 hypothetical protein DW933_02385 [Lachnospira eligens]RHL71160.1 hypothetical protein DW007_03155 [Lachnospira eligens]
MEMFNFRIIKCANGAEIIDNTLSTPYNSLTPIQMVDYINVEDSLFAMERKAKVNAKKANTDNTILHRIKSVLRRALA